MSKEQRRAFDRHSFAMRLGIHDPQTCDWCRQDSQTERPIIGPERTP